MNILTTKNNKFFYTSLHHSSSINYSSLEPQAPPIHAHARTHRLDQSKRLPHSSIVHGQIMIDNCWLNDVVDNVCDPRH